MANKQKTTASALTNFDAWKQTLTPEFIAQHKFIVLSCGACPAYGKTCNRYDTTCRGNFLNWAKGKYEEEVTACMPETKATGSGCIIGTNQSKNTAGGGRMTREEAAEQQKHAQSEAGSPATHICPVCGGTLESRGGYIRVIIGKRDMTSEVQGASWYCAECDRAWDYGDLPSNTRQLADTDACDRLRWLLAQAERVVRVDDADRAAVDRACRLMQEEHDE